MNLCVCFGWREVIIRFGTARKKKKIASKQPHHCITMKKFTRIWRWRRSQTKPRWCEVWELVKKYVWHSCRECGVSTASLVEEKGRGSGVWWSLVDHFEPKKTHTDGRTDGWTKEHRRRQLGKVGNTVAPADWICSQRKSKSHKINTHPPTLNQPFRNNEIIYSRMFTLVAVWVGEVVQQLCNHLDSIKVH